MHLLFLVALRVPVGCQSIHSERILRLQFHNYDSWFIMKFWYSCLFGPSHSCTRIALNLTDSSVIGPLTSIPSDVNKGFILSMFWTIANATDVKRNSYHLVVLGVSLNSMQKSSCLICPCELLFQIHCQSTVVAAMNNVEVASSKEYISKVE